MLIQAFRFLSLVFTALIVGSAFCHVLELPVKLTMTGADYLVVQRIYAAFGPVGAVLELGAIVSTAVLAVLVRGRGSFRPALVSALTLVTALLAWFAIVSPVNAHWAVATPEAVPPDFTSLRARWEWGHVAHTALLFAAFVSAIVSVLVDISPVPRITGAGRPAADREA